MSPQQHVHVPQAGKLGRMMKLPESFTHFHAMDIKDPRMHSLMEDLIYFEANTTPRSRRSKYFDQNGRFPYVSGKESEEGIDYWRKMVKVGHKQACLSLSPEKQFASFERDRDITKRAQKVFKLKRTAQHHAVCRCVVRRFVMWSCHGAVHDWIDNMDMVIENELNLTKALNVARQLETMRMAVVMMMKCEHFRHVTTWKSNASAALMARQTHERRKKILKSLDKKRDEAEVLAEAVIEAAAEVRMDLKHGISANDLKKLLDPESMLPVEEVMDRKTKKWVTVKPKLKELCVPRLDLDDFIIWLLDKKAAKFKRHSCKGSMGFLELKTAAREMFEHSLAIQKAEEEKTKDKERMLRMQRELRASRRWTNVFTGYAAKHPVMDLEAQFRISQRDPEFAALIETVMKHPVISELCVLIKRLGTANRLVKRNFISRSQTAKIATAKERRRNPQQKEDEFGVLEAAGAYAGATAAGEKSGEEGAGSRRGSVTTHG